MCIYGGVHTPIEPIFPTTKKNDTRVGVRTDPWTNKSEYAQVGGETYRNNPSQIPELEMDWDSEEFDMLDALIEDDVISPRDASAGQAFECHNVVCSGHAIPLHGFPQIDIPRFAQGHVARGEVLGVYLTTVCDFGQLPLATPLLVIGPCVILALKCRDVPVVPLTSGVYNARTLPLGAYYVKVCLLGGRKKKNVATQMKKAMRPVARVARNVGRAVAPIAGGMARAGLMGLAGGAGALASPMALAMGFDAMKQAAKLVTRFKRLSGSGDYTTGPDVAANTLIKGKPDIASAFRNGGHTVRVCHREYVADLLTGPVAGAFNNTSYSLNPGNTSLFPWLSALAANFEQYHVHGFVVELVSVTSPYNANASMGSVIVTTAYNTSTQPFATKGQMENSEYAISARFDQNIMYGVECADQAQELYYLRGQGVTSQDSTIPPQLLDLCNLQVATAPASTFPTGSVTHEVWISYDISLVGPRLGPSRFGYVANNNGTPTSSLAFASLAAALFDGGSTYTAAGTLSSVSFANGVVTIPNAAIGDTYLVDLTYAVTLSSGSGFSIIPVAGLGTELVTSMYGPQTAGGVSLSTSAFSATVFGNSSGAVQIGGTVATLQANVAGTVNFSFSCLGVSITNGAIDATNIKVSLIGNGFSEGFAAPGSI